ncbi:MAG: MFS transporter [Gammaproteobacteria bacterium]|nr:MFS transporter [Gammaproteobacteria bacterium]
MTQTLGRVSTLLLAVAILLVGHGLQLSLLPMRAEALGWSTGAIGATGSAYFLGFVIGCVVIPSIVSRVHHIRTFMALATLATVVLLGLGLFDSVWAWLVLRAGTGFAFAGLYMVIESWLNEASPVDRRGSILAVYTMISLLAMVLGQSFLGLTEPADLRLVMGAAFIMGIAVIPIGLTPIAAPQDIPRARFSPRVIGRASRVAVVCAFCGGLVTGSFWSVGPLVGRAHGLDGTDIGLMMAAAIVGGALIQLPVGRLSDHMDRRKVIAGLFVLGAVASLAGWLLVGDSRAALFAVMFCFGATTMPIYALCIATASDNSDLPLIQIASSILIMNSLGSILGPVLVAQVMAAMGGGGFFVFAIAGMGLGGLWALYRIAVIERPRHHDQPFTAVPRTSFVATELVDEGPVAAEEGDGAQRA